MFERIRSSPINSSLPLKQNVLVSTPFSVVYQLAYEFFSVFAGSHSEDRNEWDRRVHDLNSIIKKDKQIKLLEAQIKTLEESNVNLETQVKTLKVSEAASKEKHKELEQNYKFLKYDHDHLRTDYERVKMQWNRVYERFVLAELCQHNEY